MTKNLNFALKIKGVVGRVAHAKSSDPATPPKFGTCTRTRVITAKQQTDLRSWYIFLDYYSL